MRVRYMPGTPGGTVGGGMGIAFGGTELCGGGLYWVRGGEAGGDAGAVPEKGGLARGIAGLGFASPWGRVNPHLGQKRAPSGAS